MKTLGWAAFFYSLCAAAPLCAETWTVSLKAVNGRAAYAHEMELPAGKQASFSGRPRMRGGGPARDLVFHAYLNEPEGGYLRLDYMAELSGENRARPPFQAAGKVRLRPGKPALAVSAGGWKLIFELKGAAEGKPNGGGAVLETALRCGRAFYPANFAYLPDEQYSVVLYGGEEDAVRRYTVGLLPNAPGADGAFKLQYALQLKEGGEALAENQGELILAPGAGKVTAAAGQGCVFSARALR